MFIISHVNLFYAPHPWLPGAFAPAIPPHPIATPLGIKNSHRRWNGTNYKDFSQRGGKNRTKFLSHPTPPQSKNNNNAIKYTLSHFLISSCRLCAILTKVTPCDGDHSTRSRDRSTGVNRCTTGRTGCRPFDASALPSRRLGLWRVLRDRRLTCNGVSPSDFSDVYVGTLKAVCIAL